MNNKQYLKLCDQVSEMNRINDEISLIELNKDDGPKFSSVEEMKDFERRLKNNEFDYLLGSGEDLPDTSDIIIESFTHTLDDILFHIYTYQNRSDFNYVTYMCLTNIKDNNQIDKLCGKSTPNQESAHKYFEILKNEVTTNSISDILDSLIIGAEKTIISSKKELSKLTSES